MSNVNHAQLAAELLDWAENTPTASRGGDITPVPPMAPELRGRGQAIAAAQVHVLLAQEGN